MPEEIIKINEVAFSPIKGINYKYDYVDVAEGIKSGKFDEFSIFRQIIKEDIWFILNFIMAIPGSNRKFVVEAAQEVEAGKDEWTLDLWARLHYKSSIITKARTIQRVLNEPEKCTMIVSHTRPMAKKFLRPIKIGRAHV